MNYFILRPIPQPHLELMLSTTHVSSSLNRVKQPPLAPCLNMRMLLCYPSVLS